MAEIPVERKEKSGLPWWLIPLALLLLLPLLFFNFCNRGTTVVDNTNNNANRTIVTTNMNGNTMMANNTSNVAVVVNSNVNTGLGNAANTVSDSVRNNTGPMITDTSFFAGVNDKMSLVGREANFTKVRVNRVLSDRVFTVKSGAGEMFAMLDENLDSGGGKEKQIKIQAGQSLDLGGTFRTIPTAEVKDEAQNRDLNQKEYAQMKGQQIYLHVNNVSDAR